MKHRNGTCINKKIKSKKILLKVAPKKLVVDEEETIQNVDHINLNQEEDSGDIYSGEDNDNVQCKLFVILYS